MRTADKIVFTTVLALVMAGLALAYHDVSTQRATAEQRTKDYADACKIRGGSPVHNGSHWVCLSGIEDD